MGVLLSIAQPDWRSYGHKWGVINAGADDASVFLVLPSLTGGLTDTNGE